MGALDAVLYAFGKRRSAGFRERMQQDEVFDLTETCRLFPMYQSKPHDAQYNLLNSRANRGMEVDREIVTCREQHRAFTA